MPILVRSMLPAKRRTARAPSLLFLMFLPGVAGCATESHLVAVRSDGQQMRGNPVLSHQFEKDRLVCVGEMQKANMSGALVPRGGVVQQTVDELQREKAARDVFAGCLAQKGYFLVSAGEAQSRADQLRAATTSDKTTAAPGQASVSLLDDAATEIGIHHSSPASG